MKEMRMGIIESKFADLIWQHEPITTSELIKLCESQFDWKRTTTYTVLKRLSDTGESNVNIDSPACLLPSTVTHELAHQRGIASEQECNFLAVAAATSAEDPAYRYSGYLMGYIHLSNALYRADPAR